MSVEKQLKAKSGYGMLVAVAVALIYLARFMQRKGMKLIDCQLETSHLRSMGGRFIGYDDYLKIINDDDES